MWLYVMQFVLWPVIARDNWQGLDPYAGQVATLMHELHRVSRFFGNTLYLVALGYYTIISFLGYNGKSTSLHPTRVRDAD